jgi:hypothetical protein
MKFSLVIVIKTNIAMILTRELIEYAKKEVQISQILSKGEKVIAQHILYEQFIEKTKWKSLPKLIFYILLEEEFGAPYLKDSNGDLGYSLIFNNDQKPKVV